MVEEEVEVVMEDMPNYQQQNKQSNMNCYWSKLVEREVKEEGQVVLVV